MFRKKIKILVLYFLYYEPKGVIKSKSNYIECQVLSEIIALEGSCYPDKNIFLIIINIMIGQFPFRKRSSKK